MTALCKIYQLKTWFRCIVLLDKSAFLYIIAVWTNFILLSTKINIFKAMSLAHVAKWKGLLTFNHLLLTAVGSNPAREWILSCEDPSRIWSVSGSTQVPTYAWNNTRNGAWGLFPPVKAGNVTIWPKQCCVTSCHFTLVYFISISYIMNILLFHSFTLLCHITSHNYCYYCYFYISIYLTLI